MKEELHRLVEELPESDLPVARRLLRGLSLPDEPAPAPVSREERRANVRAAYGFLKGSGRTLDAFLREKHEDIEREEERYHRRHGDAA